MPVDGHESMSVTIHARQRLRELQAMLVRLGVPKGIGAPPALTLSAVVEIAVATTERELKKGKR